jgi:outer membrane protein OmpA-like peptidoglycan-associated protein
MKKIFAIVFVFLTGSLTAQLTGNWKGVLLYEGQKNSQSKIIYFSFGEGENKSREEIPDGDGYINRILKKEKKGSVWKVTQTTSVGKKDVFGHRWCILEFELAYNDSTGYLQGKFISNECRGNLGKVICFKTTEKLPEGATDKSTQLWRTAFLEDIAAGRKSKEIRDLERKNFTFQPVYFDYDQSEIREQDKPFLDRISYIVNSHTDLRIRVTGNTDADGSDLYNDKLSESRAKAIIDYLVKKGIAKDRIEIDFKGEQNPVGDNNNAEGKQLNRRVDFEFI